MKESDNDNLEENLVEDNLIDNMNSENKVNKKMELPEINSIILLFIILYV